VDNVRAYLDILEWVAPDPEALATNDIKPTETKGAIKRTPRQGKGQAQRSPSP
jgi:hypothetical protein